MHNLIEAISEDGCLMVLRTRSRPEPYRVTIDASAVEAVAPFKWSALVVVHRAATKVYGTAYAKGHPLASKSGCLLLHRLLLNAHRGQLVDHIDGDTLNNRKSNLRITDHAGNTCNSRQRIGLSGFRGVRKRRDCAGFEARIWINNKCVPLGKFGTAVEAARVRDAAAISHYGEFAVLNFPNEIDQPATGTRQTA